MSSTPAAAAATAAVSVGEQAAAPVAVSAAAPVSGETNGSHGEGKHPPSDAIPPSPSPAPAAADPRLRYAITLSNGAPFLKYGRTGKPHLDVVKTSLDFSKVYWGKKCVPTSELISVQPGRDSPVFKKFDSSNPAPTQEDRHLLTSISFALIFNSRSLDLQVEGYGKQKTDTKKIARDQATRDEWVAAFQWLLAQQATVNNKKRDATSPTRTENGTIDTNADADSGISRPQNVVRTTHVNQNFQWERERLDSDFTLIRKLGAGAFAEVWLAKHNLLQFEVAVKTVQLSSDPKIAAKEKEEIESEIAILQLAKNRYICGFLGCCPTPDSRGRIWIMMDHFSRGSILNLIQHTQLRLGEAEIAYIIHCVLFGLTFLNSRNICHRDIKCRNILMNDKGDIALADFGVSKILHRDGTPVDGSTSEQLPTNIAGSPCFMAPEVIEGKTPDFKADVWSVGITCLELANGGRVPHDDLPTPFRVMRAIKSSAPPSLQWTPATQGERAEGASAIHLNGPTPVWSPAFHDFVSRCLQPNPALRTDAVSLLSHPFVAGAFSPAVMAGQLKAYEEAERKRAKRLRKSTSSAASTVGGGKPSILDSLFKLLGRKGVSHSIKPHVDALREKGKLDEMGEDANEPTGGEEDDDGGTVVLNAGEDTTIMQIDDGMDEEDQNGHARIADELIQTNSEPNKSTDTPNTHVPVEPTAINSPHPSTVSAVPPTATAATSQPSTPPLHALDHAPRKSMSADVLIRCSTSQLALVGGEVGIDAKLLQLFLSRVASKYGTLIPTSASSINAAPRHKPAHARKSTGASGAAPMPNQAGDDAAACGEDEPASSSSPTSLFPGCTPSSDAEEYISALEYCTVMVCGLSRNDLTSLKRMTNAPPPVRMAIESVALVLGYKPHQISSGPRKGASKTKPTYDYWSTAQALLVRPNFLTQLKTYDFRQLSPEIIDRLFEFGTDKPASYTPAIVSSSSTTAGILWDWTRSVYGYAVHCIGYRPEGWTADAEPTALTLKWTETQAETTADSQANAPSNQAAKLTSPVVTKPRRPASQHLDSSLIAEANGGGGGSGSKPHASHRRGSFGASYPSITLPTPASSGPLQSPVSAPAPAPAPSGASTKAAAAPLKRVTSATQPESNTDAHTRKTAGRTSPAPSTNTPVSGAAGSIPSVDPPVTARNKPTSTVTGPPVPIRRPSTTLPKKPSSSTTSASPTRSSAPPLVRKSSATATATATVTAAGATTPRVTPTATPTTARPTTANATTTPPKRASMLPPTHRPATATQKTTTTSATATKKLPA